MHRAAHRGIEDGHRETRVNHPDRVVEELARLGRIEKANVQIRAHQLPPRFKTYILNGDEVLFGLYPLVNHTTRSREASVTSST